VPTHTTSTTTITTPDLETIGPENRRPHLVVPSCSINRVAAALVVPRKQHARHLELRLVVLEAAEWQIQRQQEGSFQGSYERSASWGQFLGPRGVRSWFDK
jgi:hypothetical protein